MSDIVDAEVIVKLERELAVQRKLVEQITTGAAPVASRLDIKKEFKGIISGLAQEVRSLLAGATKEAFAAEGANAVGTVMLDTFTSVDDIIKKYESWASDNLIADSTLVSTSRQIADHVESDVKEAHARIKAFRRIQDQDLESAGLREPGTHPEALRRQRQFASAQVEQGTEDKG